VERVGSEHWLVKGLPELGDTYPLVQRVDKRRKVPLRLLFQGLRLRAQSTDMQPHRHRHASQEAVQGGHRPSPSSRRSACRRPRPLWQDPRGAASPAPRQCACVFLVTNALLIGLSCLSLQSVFARPVSSSHLATLSHTSALTSTIMAKR